MPTYVNLDALVPREDFAIEAPENISSDLFEKLGIDRLLSTSGSSITAHIRKPDFQRETNHWRPEQICTFLQSFTANDLIPSLILWNSKTHIFVIDGCHRISVLRAWIEDDYGDGALSLAHFGIELPKEQKSAAKRTREMIKKTVGSFKDLQLVNNDPSKYQADLVQRAKTALTRSLQIQWISGNAEKAETSFFKINTQGTALDKVEERLLRNRKKPVAIAARAVVRAGRGHRYWSGFEAEVRAEIEQLAQEIFDALFEPELSVPVKTLNIPIGGPYSSRNALDLLMDFIETVDGAFGSSTAIELDDDDDDGSATVKTLRHCQQTANRIVGTYGGSLGLDPAVYFYSPTGRFNRDIFLALTELFALAERNNNTGFFFKFTKARKKLEAVLIANKQLLTQLNVAIHSKSRRAVWTKVFTELIDRCGKGHDVSPEDITGSAGFTGDTLIQKKVSAAISDEVKSATFLTAALSMALHCPECGGVLSPKSFSYDHKTPKSQGGTGSAKNVQITHPFCNTGYKNSKSQAMNDA